MSGHPTAVFLALGSNLGQREASLHGALADLAGSGLRLTRRSSLYLTEPVGGPSQEWFLNAVAELQTELDPEALLDLCLRVESLRGRRREVRHGPRTLDLDILLHGDTVRAAPELTLPHPRLHQRRFVLVPLCEIAPDVRHPLLGLTAAELLARCPDRSVVRLHQARA